jgi:hypothetical protein
MLARDQMTIRTVAVAGADSAIGPTHIQAEAIPETGHGCIQYGEDSAEPAGIAGNGLRELGQ